VLILEDWQTFLSGPIWGKVSFQLAKTESKTAVKMEKNNVYYNFHNIILESPAHLWSSISFIGHTALLLSPETFYPHLLEA
jgi:hypothetical protein